MNRDDARDLEIQALRDRLSRLSEASLRINESLDFDTVLQGVLDSARALTEARYGAMTLLDAAVELPPDWDPMTNALGSNLPLVDYFTSGLTEEQVRRMQDMPERMLLFDYLRRIPGTWRVPDLASHIASLGMDEFNALPVGPFLSAPLRHQGDLVGAVFLARDIGMGEFGQEDEEILVMFASQAAMVIANARRYREEQRARNDLETLINTSPVGVAVFDARTGAPVSFNQEAVRIVDSLRDPDQSPEQLLEVLSYRRADGRKISPFDIAKELIEGDTVQAEEIVIEVPDGRSVTTLVNATPIRSGNGDGRVLHRDHSGHDGAGGA